MFSSKAQLQKHTPESGTDRENYLSLLLDEYLNSNSHEAKCQVLANLANFAYDPINYEYIRNVGVLDIFLHVVKNEKDHTLLHFANAGISNLCIDPLNTEYIIKQNGLAPLKNLLRSENNDTIADCITILIYLYNDTTKSQINTPEIVHFMHNTKKSEDKRLSNLASIFIRDVCGATDDA